MDYPDDAGLVSVLTHLGAGPDALLGHGGEAWVYALDDLTVVRVLHESGTRDQLRRNQELIEELSASSAGFALPHVIEVDERGGRIYSIERRLPGHSVLAALENASGSARDRLIEAHLETATALSGLSLRRRDYFGDLASPAPIRARTWREYVQRKADAALQASGINWQANGSMLADALPEPDLVGFVHLDAFVGNMMTDGHRITAVLDIGPSCVRGDVRFNALAAAVYLESPETTPMATTRDLQVTHSWLASCDLLRLLEPARAWLAAYWSFEVDDPKVLAWVRSVLAP
jgi:aminoglycoside phosphotransferase (APT) family kinase protein